MTCPRCQVRRAQLVRVQRYGVRVRYLQHGGSCAGWSSMAWLATDSPPPRLVWFVCLGAFCVHLPVQPFHSSSPRPACCLPDPPLPFHNGVCAATTSFSSFGILLHLHPRKHIFPLVLFDPLLPSCTVHRPVVGLEPVLAPYVSCLRSPRPTLSTGCPPGRLTAAARLFGGIRSTIVPFKHQAAPAGAFCECQILIRQPSLCRAPQECPC